MGYHLQSIIFVSHKLYFQRLPHNRTDVGGFYCIYLGIGHNTVNVIVSQCRQRHAGLVYAVEIGKKSAAAGQVIILAVQRENHGAGAANDLCAGNEAVNSAIGAVISIVAQHEVLILRHDGGAVASTGATDEMAGQPGLVGLARQILENDEGVITPRQDMIVGGRAVDHQPVILHIDGIAGNADNAFDQAFIGLLGVDNHDISAPGIGNFRQRDFREGDFDVVGKLVDPDLVAIKQRGLHGSTGDGTQVSDCTLEEDDTGQEQEELSVLLPKHA